MLDIHRALLRRRRRHRDDEHLHRDHDRTGRLRARGRRQRDEPRGRAARPRRPPTRCGGLRRGLGRAAERHALALAEGRRPAYRHVTFDAVRDAYAEQMRALAEGGVDLFLIETIFDTLNAKAAIVAALEGRPTCRSGSRSPRSTRAAATCPGRRSRRSGLSVEHARAADRRRQLLARRRRRCGRSSRTSRGSRRPYVACHPNAGLPNEFGGYDEQPARHEPAARASSRADGLVNIVGGCCGTTPEHIEAIVEAVEGVAPRVSRSRVA